MDLLLLFFLNWSVNILLIEFLSLKKLKAIVNVDEKRDSMFQAFKRHDTYWLNRCWLYLTCHLAVLRVCFSFTALFICSVANTTVCIGKKPDEPVQGLRYRVVRFMTWFASWAVLWSGSGAFWISYKRPQFCYKKYLGPDWEPDYDEETCATVISNHSSFLDSAVHCIG